MESGDGLIVRVRTSSRPVSARDVSALANMAETYGNGLLEITRRANVQLRGVSQETLAALQNDLVTAGLGDAEPWRERIPALIVDPLADLSPAFAELGPVTRMLEERLASPSLALLLAAMPHKLAIAIEGGGLAMHDLSADIRIERTRQQPHLSFLSLDDTGQVARLGALHTSDVPEAVVTLLEVLSALSSDGPLRMREAIARYSLSPFVTALRARLIAAEPARAPARTSAPLFGFHGGEEGFFGLGIALGSANAAQWRELATLAQRFGDGMLRTTPRRSVIVTGVRSDTCAWLAREAQNAGFIVDASDVLTRVIACAGAPRCRSAWHETRLFAAQLAQAIAPALIDRTLHVSGCAKGCASSGQASITLVHQAEGCKLGFDASVTDTMLGPTLSPAEAHRELRAFERERTPTRESAALRESTDEPAREVTP
jgi:precorrin-3B synthase